MSTITAMSEKFSPELIANAPNAMVVVDSTGIIVAVNSAAEQIFGYDPDQLVGEPVEILLPARYRTAHRLMRRRHMSNPEPRLMGSGRELKGLRKDGSEFDVEVGLNPVSTPQGMATLVAVSDISSRKSAEHCENTSKELFNAIFRSSPFSIITTDTAGLIIAMNPAAERLLWYGEGELLGKPSTEVLHDPQLLRQRAWQLSEEFGERIGPGFDAISRNARLGISEEIDWHYLRKDGTPLPVRLTITALRDLDNCIVGYLGMAYDLSERQRAQQYINHIALHDELTGLPNRTMLHNRLDQEIQRCNGTEIRLAVMLVDLDNFKRLNDSLGHNIGDQVLLHVASEIKKSVSEDALVARMGGDEFAVLLPQEGDHDDLGRVAETIIQCVSKPITVAHHRLKITPSIGICLYPDHGEDVDTLVMRAETAMYAAKERGRCNYQIFTEFMAAQLRERLDLEHALQRALELDQFSLHYQSQVDLKTGQTVGVETLLRWHLPGTGNISPTRFIDIAEESELIVPIGEWVLRKACEDGVRLQQLYGTPCVVAVNLSPRQLMQGNLVSMVAEALSDSGLPPELLELEITENIFMHHAEELQLTLQRIRELGVRIAIDDFGTGYSSLSYITRFPIDRIKIDLSFVQNMLTDPNCRAVTNAVIAMAHGLGVDVVAEGVETREQLEYLGRQNCTHGQGFLFARPQPLEQLLLEDRSVESMRISTH